MSKPISDGEVDTGFAPRVRTNTGILFGAYSGKTAPRGKTAENRDDACSPEGKPEKIQVAGRPLRLTPRATDGGWKAL